MKHGSLFSGIGGFDLAAKWCGWDNVFQIEKDNWCRKVLAKNFPKTKRYNDIKEFDGKEYENRIDVISGGFPCQPFSIAGKQRGKYDDRFLWPEMLRVIGQIRPSFVVCENVPGIIKLALDTVLSDLEASGYTTETFIIPACAKNAWHRRDRVWIIAYTHSIRSNRTSRSLSGENEEIRLQERQQMEHPNKSSEVWISSDAYRKRIKEQWEPIDIQKELFAPKCNSWWEAEPGMDRVVNGLSNRVHRLKGLGNAIVPQVAYEIFKAINNLSL